MVLVKDFEHARKLFESYISYDKVERRYTLDRMRLLMDYLGNPQNEVKTVHVAGTSGKTSTSYYAAALLIESGYTVGLAVSPYVDTVAERSQVNLEVLPEALYCSELGKYFDLVTKSGITPSYFENLVAFSFWLFKRQGVDYAVIEVGLGGLLDTTNVIYREDKTCIITDIGYDHTEILGNTLEEIAAQKAGIIQKENRVFMHGQTAEVVQVVQEKADNESATLTVVDIDEALATALEFHNLPLFQQRNFSLAYSAVKDIISQSDESKGLIEKALSVYIPARMEVVRWKEKAIILDGSHNEQKVAALVESVKNKYYGQSVVLLVSFGQKKASSLFAVLTSLREISSHIIITKFDGEKSSIRKSINTESVSTIANRLGFVTEVKDSPAEAFEYATSGDEQIVLVTGSFFLLNHVRPIVKERG